MEPTMRPKLQVIGGSSHLDFTRTVCKHLGTSAANTVLKKFSSGETRVEVCESLRGANVYIVQSPRPGKFINDDLMELLLLVNACKMASAAKIVAVVPCFAYARQDNPFC